MTESFDLSAVMVDNYDSFTFNLVQYFQELGIEVLTIRNDEKTVDELIALKPDFFVISPGPSTPDQAGVSLALIKKITQNNLALLGVCLGHQAIAQAFGGKILRATEPMHGKVSAIRHLNRGVFQGLANPLQATRYHSLIVERSSLPAELEITAETDDGTIMGLRHRFKLIEGVQFHPESVLTEGGRVMLANFAKAVKARQR